MPKILIREACAVASGDEGRTRHADVGETADASKDDALLLCRMGRAFFVDKSDDPTKGLLTATADDKVAIKQHVAAIAEERQTRASVAAASTPVGLATLVAVEVAKAIAAGQQAAKA